MESSAVARPQARVQEMPPWLMVAVVVAGHAIKHMYSSSFYVILPGIRASYGLSYTALGTLSTARSLVGALTNLPAGFLADRFSGHWSAILGLSMILLGVFQFLMGTVGSYGLLVITTTIAGAAIAFWHPPAIAALSQRFVHRRGFMISLHGSGGSVGETLGPVIVGALLTVLVWQKVLQWSLVPAVATGVLVWLLMLRERGQSAGELTAASYLAAMRLLLRNRAFLVLLVVTAAFSASQGGFITFLPNYLQFELGYSQFVMASFISLARVGGIVSQPVLGLLSDRLSRRAVVLPSMLCLSAGMLAVSMVPPGWPLVVAITFTGAFEFPLMALLLATAMDMVKEEVQGTTVSLVFGTAFLFGSLSPTLAGLLADAFGVQAVFIYSAAIILPAAGLFFFSSRPGSR